MKKRKLPMWAAVLIIFGIRFLEASEYVEHTNLEDTILD
jgi:hypothetical protein